MRGINLGALGLLLLAAPVLAQNAPPPSSTLPPPSPKRPAKDACLYPKTPPEKRISACTSAIESRRLSDTDLAKAYNNRGIAAHYLGQYDRAIFDHREAARLRPDYAESYSDRGNAVLGDTEKALADCDSAIKLAPKRTATLYDSRGYALTRAKRYDAAIRDFSTALEIDPKHASALWGRGYVYMRKGETEKAQRDFATARVIDPAIEYKMVDIGLTAE